jgi:hypothetical protein
MKKESKKDIKKVPTEDEMKLILVNTLTGKMSLSDLCFKVGISKRVQYFNMVEKRSKSIEAPFRVVKVVHDLGFIFNDGFEIRHVNSKHFNFFPSIDVLERRERI